MTEKDLALVPGKETASVNVSVKDPEIEEDGTGPGKDLEIVSVTADTGNENGLEIAVESDPKNDQNDLGIVSVLVLPLVVVPAPAPVLVVALLAFSI